MKIINRRVIADWVSLLLLCSAVFIEASVVGNVTTSEFIVSIAVYKLGEVFKTNSYETRRTMFNTI